MYVVDKGFCQKYNVFVVKYTFQTETSRLRVGWVSVINFRTMKENFQ